MDQIVPPPPIECTDAVCKKRAKIIMKRKAKIDNLRKQFQRESALEEKSLRRFLPEWERNHKHHILEGLLEEIDVWDEKTKDLLTRKDEKIEILFNTLEESYEMEMRSISTFCDQLDYFSRCHQTLKQAALNIYEMRTFELVHDFLSQTKKHLDEPEKLDDHMMNYTYATNIRHMSLLRKNHADYMAKKFGKVCLEVAQRDSLRDSTFKKMRTLQDRLLNWIKNLKDDNLDVERPIKCRHLMRRQRDQVRHIHSLGEVEQACIKQIMNLKDELLTVELDRNERQFALQKELGYFMEIKSILKAFIDKNISMTNKKLLVDANASYEVIKALKEIAKNGERVLEMAANCRKYETDKEKIAPFKNENPSVIEDDSDLDLTYDLGKLCDISENEIQKQMIYMKYFWQRCSKVSLHNIMLKEDKRKLTEENQKYRNLIRTIRMEPRFNTKNT